MIWESFFDETGSEADKFNLWKRNNPAQKLQQQPVIYSGYLMKFDKDSSELKERLFV
jgi:hypothetical protein